MSKKNNLVLKLLALIGVCKNVVNDLIAPGETITVPFTEEDTDEMSTTDNLGIMVEVDEDKGPFYLSVKTISRDQKGNLLLSGLDEKNYKEYEPMNMYIFDESWPFLAEAVKNIKNIK